jgi:indole-3-glycerol phosphate synthase
VFAKTDSNAVIMNLLDEIILYKKREIAERKKEWDIAQLQKSQHYNRSIHSLKRVLLDGKTTGIIAEYKRRSPSKGMLNNTADIGAVTRAYTENGAAGLSVLTDEKFFSGSVSDLLIARSNPIPIIRKDFIIDEYQLIGSRSIGADAVLLIAACLTPLQVRTLANAAGKLGLESLLEIHNEEELDHICDEVDMIGINNRDLKTFEVNIDLSFKLINKIPAGKPVISESGIGDPATVIELRKAGFKGFLIGETFMREPDPGLAFKQFVNEINKAPL